jgi:2-oxoisovalerate dehydrogenase E1 component
VGSLETPIPFSKALEEGYLPKKRFYTVLQDLLQY